MSKVCASVTQVWVSNVKLVSIVQKVFDKAGVGLSMVEPFPSCP